MSAKGHQTQFDISEFETEITEAEKSAVINAISDAISRLRDQIKDDTLESMLRAEPGSYQLRGDFTKDALDPEPLTQGVIIEPFLDALGHQNYGWEAGDLSDKRGEQADYAISLRDVENVDSTRLLIEAEPINKSLTNTRGHGVDQVKSWLSQREFQTDFGFATDGIRWIFIRYDPDSYTHNTIEHVDLQPVFLKLFENTVGENRPPAEALNDEEEALVEDLIRTFAFDNFVSIITDAREVIKEKQEAITDEFYDDYVRLVFGIGAEDDEERRSRSLVGGGIIPPEQASGDDVRLFSVHLMNRMIFVKFLEDKKIVRPDLLNTLKQVYDDGMYPQTFYQTFLEPLFYDVFNVKPENREPQIDQIDPFEGIPYLNGGLFRPELNGSDELDEREFNVRDSVLMSIIELLERYQFSADGGPTDIDPSVLGNVFEKTINYITIDDKNKNKELGAYYTPSEITRFCAEETVRPALLELFKSHLQEEWGWRQAELDHYDQLYDLIDALTENKDLITGLLDELNEFYVVDPACGSGHFLTSVVEEIVNTRQALYAQMGSHPSRHRLKTTTVQNNMYGVDIMDSGIEITKLRLWLSIIAELQEDDLDSLSQEELALPNIVFNIRQGNSLIGYLGFPDETDDGEYTFENWSDDSVERRYKDIIDEINAYQESNAFPEKAEEHRQNAKDLLKEYRSDLDNKTVDQFRAFTENVTDEDVRAHDTFHWVLEFAEVFADEGFDVVVGNPPWDEIKSDRKEFFVKYDPVFRSLPTHGMDERQKELLEDEDIKNEWETYQSRVAQLGDYFKHSTEYEYQQPEIDGRKQPIANNLAALFLERIYDLVHDGGYVAQVLPDIIFNNAMGKDLRMHLLNNTSVQSLVGFENKGIFDGLHDQYVFRLLTFQNTGETDYLNGISRQHDVSILNNIGEHTFKIPKEVLAEYSPEVRLFPIIRTEEELGVISNVVQHPSVGDRIDGAWNSDPYYEIKKGPDNDRITDSEDIGDYPVYQGKNIYQFIHNDSILDDIEDIEYWSVEDDTDTVKSAKHRVREKNLGNLKRSLYYAFGGDETSQSQVQFVDDLLKKHRGEPLSEDDVKLDCTDYRIIYRFITNATNERTFIATVIPPSIINLHSIYTIRPFEINPSKDDLAESPLWPAYEPAFTDEEMMAATGLLNSIPFDFIMRTKVNKEIYQYTFKETQVPRLTAGDEWFEYIWTRAARLNCYGEEFADLRERLGGVEPVTDVDERQELQAEIDAAAFHAYGLNAAETEFVLDDFYKVNSPRLMTDEYFESVFEKFEELAETAPAAEQS
jgi:hypothetical protein